MKGFVDLPGDKSISHRVAMIASVAADRCRIENFNRGKDCASTLDCLQQLGIGVEVTNRSEMTDVLIQPAPFKSPSGPLHCGNSGSTIRMLTGLLAGQDVPATLIGDISLLRRPMKRVADPLRLMGAAVELRDENYPPVIVLEGAKHPIRYEMPVASAQVKTAILFAGLRFRGTMVLEPFPTRDHTERLLQYLQFTPSRSQPFRAFQYTIPGDPSAAAFFIAAALLHEDSDITIRHMLMNPHRVGYIRKLKQSGARIDVMHQHLQQNELIADVRIQTSRLSTPITISPDEVPSMIDELPVLSIVGTLCGFEVRGAAELRHKESDRIEAIIMNLDEMGIRVEEYDDGYAIYPGMLKQTVARTYDDHRIAMTFGAAGIEVDNPECADVSFPGFFELLDSLRT